MEMQNKAKSVQFMPQVSAKSVVPMFVQNKPNFQRFQSKIKGCSKNKTKVAIHGHSERSEESLCAKQSQLDIATMKKQNEPKWDRGGASRPTWKCKTKPILTNALYMMGAAFKQLVASKRSEDGSLGVDFTKQTQM